MKLNADLLLWAYLPQQSWAYELEGNISGGTGVAVSSKLQPGFRISGEYPMVGCGGGWSLYGSYTYFYAGLYDSINAANITPAFTNLSAILMTRGNALIGIHINFFELAVQKEIWLCRNFAWTPFIELFGASSVDNEAYNFKNATLFDFINRSEKGCGVGPSLGFGYEYYVSPCLSLIGRSLAGTFVGRERSTTTEFTGTLGAAPTGSYNKQEGVMSLGLYVESRIGLLSHWCWRTYAWTLGANWETAVLTQHNNRLFFTGLAITSGISF